MRRRNDLTNAVLFSDRSNSSDVFERVFGEFLKLVRGEGSAAIVATHNERLALAMDRVVRLHEGKLE